MTKKEWDSLKKDKEQYLEKYKEFIITHTIHTIVKSAQKTLTKKVQHLSIG